MEHPPISSSEEPVLDVKPLRCLAPMFPAPIGFTSFSAPNAPSFVTVSPFGPFPSSPSVSGFSSLSPPIPSGAHKQLKPVLTTLNECVNHESGPPVAKDQAYPSEYPQTGTPPSLHTPKKFAVSTTVLKSEMDGERVINSVIPSSSEDNVLVQNKKKVPHSEIYDISSLGSGTGSTGLYSRKSKPRKKVKSNDMAIIPSQSDCGKDSVDRILMMFDGIRRRFLQLEDVKEGSGTGNKRPDLKAGTTMMTRGFRVNLTKRIGDIPGIDIGDIFFFRFELCLVGMHAQIMGGIDYTSMKFDHEDELLALSIVSSGGYDDEANDPYVLIYSGQGGHNSRNDAKPADDQKLERGNLALERSLHRGNNIRVIRGTKDMWNPTGKIYIYDGLYKIQEAWKEKSNRGGNVFKYKLVRIPVQPEAFGVWKSIQQWRENPNSRPGLILPDISSGGEMVPVSLVNDVDEEKGPAHFSYSSRVKYTKQVDSLGISTGCQCHSMCFPGDDDCNCVLKNGGDLPYSSGGILVSRKPFVYECSSSCSCFLGCRTRVTQKGIRIRFEVFRTTNRGWGLRSWDPIRAGSFLCEYTGEVIDDMKLKGGDDDDDNYIFEAKHAVDNSSDYNYLHELLEEDKPEELNETSKSSIIISAKNVGNVSRFMNHSCSPNVLWQPVLFDHHDERYPHIMFFASKHIPPLTELTYDYGQGSEGCRRRKQCLCGSPKCRGFYY